MKKRMTSFTVAVCFLFSVIGGRIGFIIFSGNYAVSAAYNSYTLTIDTLYPTVYDRNMVKLTNKSKSLSAVIRPNEKCLAELDLLFDSGERQEVINELKQGYPVIRKIDSFAVCRHIKIFETGMRHDSDMPAKHLITAAEKLYDDEIGEKSVNFTVDAKGRLLEGDEGTVTENNYNSKAGVSLTIDSSIQKSVENAAENMKKGAVAVLDCNTNKVLAIYSKPDDYLNRALTPYSVGSVYKLVVAACALESGISQNYECTGEITVGDTTFSCQKKKAHGNQGIREALANSCNCFFINLALMLGAERLTEMSEKFGFGEVMELSSDWSVKSGSFPDMKVLKSKGQLSLLGFGQGSLTTTPLQFATVVSAIANGGMYIPPSVFEGVVNDNGKFTEFGSKLPVRVMSSETARTLREYMRYVVTNGTGASAEYKKSSAGKTSTAQSGIYKDSREILNTWFAGFYPYNNPQYTIVVMTEDGTSGSVDCCPIFRSIVENLDK